VGAGAGAGGDRLDHPDRRFSAPVDLPGVLVVFLFKHYKGKTIMVFHYKILQRKNHYGFSIRNFK
jgi:hypothetical protein